VKQQGGSWNRRAFLARTGGVAAAAAAALVTAPASAQAGVPGGGAAGVEGFEAGSVRHILPSATHERFVVKVSFRGPQQAEPVLLVDDLRVPGRMTDTMGECFEFDARGLSADHEYTLRIVDSAGAAVTSTWPLRTFPAPDSRASSFRLACITCAGGPEEFLGPNAGGFPPLVPQFQPLRVKRRLLDRMRSFAPDAMHANGDHIYWDTRSIPSSIAQGRSPQAAVIGGGYFDRNQPVKGTANEQILKRDFGPQIADLYGVEWRSTPVYFVRDDHDYLDNDEATDAARTFPPDRFAFDTARATQDFYYPELFAGYDMPSEYANADGRSPDFGVLRYGDLFEGWIYNAKGLMNNTRDPAQPDYNNNPGRDGHPEARLVPKPIEQWLIKRTRSTTASHIAHIPSSPILWGAGKFAEWYPDLLGKDGELSADLDKPFWPSGWHDQHDRLVVATSERRDRIPLWVSGDLHCSALGTISRTRDHDLSANPVVSLCVGTPGSSTPGFPSSFRGTPPIPSTTLTAQEIVQPLEENGFTLIDFTPEAITISMFRWNHRTQPEEAIDTLDPFLVHRIPRRSR